MLWQILQFIWSQSTKSTFVIGYLLWSGGNEYNKKESVANIDVLHRHCHGMYQLLFGSIIDLPLNLEIMYDDEVMYEYVDRFLFSNEGYFPNIC